LLRKDYFFLLFFKDRGSGVFLFFPPLRVLVFGFTAKAFHRRPGAHPPAHPLAGWTVLGLAACVIFVTQILSLFAFLFSPPPVSFYISLLGILSAFFFSPSAPSFFFFCLQHSPLCPFSVPPLHARLLGFLYSSLAGVGWFLIPVLFVLRVSASSL